VIRHGEGDVSLLDKFAYLVRFKPRDTEETPPNWWRPWRARVAIAVNIWPARGWQGNWTC